MLGKTTLIKSLATLVKPTSGGARIAGFDLVAEPDRVRSAISLSGQYSAVDADLTVAENLILVGNLYGLDRPTQRADNIRATPCS